MTTAKLPADSVQKDDSSLVAHQTCHRGTEDVCTTLATSVHEHKCPVMSKPYLCISVKALQSFLDGFVHVLTGPKSLQVCCEAVVAFVVAACPSKLFSQEFVDCCCCCRILRTQCLTCRSRRTVYAELPGCRKQDMHPCRSDAYLWLCPECS